MMAIASFAPAQRRCLILGVLTAIATLIVTVMLFPTIGSMARVGLMIGVGLLPLAAFPLLGSNRGLRDAGAGIAITGVALAIIGLASGSAFGLTQTQMVGQGDQISVGPWQVRVAAIDPVAGPDYTAIEARLRASRGSGVVLLDPQWRTPLGRGNDVSPMVDRTDRTSRLSASLGQPSGDQWPLTLRWVPLQSMSWIGLGVVVLGGIVALAGRSRRAAIVALGIIALGSAYYYARGIHQTGPSAANRTPPQSQAAVRTQFIGQFNQANQWLIMADSFASRGKTEDSAGILLGAVRAHPRNYALWLGLGNALVDHANALSPAARLAYARSIKLAPTSAAPGYFLGNAMRRSGDIAGAEAQYREILAAAPADAQWRPLVEDELVSIERGSAR